MALMKCKECGNEVSDKADKCPSCGVAVPKKMGALKVIGIVIGVLFIIGIFAGGNNSNDQSSPNTNPIGDMMAEAGASQMDSITLQVAKDSEEQYNIAKRQGDKMQICVQAMGVSAAYLQAKDEASYNKWKDIERDDCDAAGMPRQ